MSSASVAHAAAHVLRMLTPLRGCEQPVACVKGYVSADVCYRMLTYAYVSMAYVGIRQHSLPLKQALGEPLGLRFSWVLAVNDPALERPLPCNNHI
jgi:hypothetical protein